jgi:hypothetical protein
MAIGGGTSGTRRQTSGSTVSRDPRSPSARHSEAWIVDFDGVHLLIASGSLGSATEGAVMAEIRQMVESIHFER